MKKGATGLRPAARKDPEGSGEENAATQGGAAAGTAPRPKGEEQGHATARYALYPT